MRPIILSLSLCAVQCSSWGTFWSVTPKTLSVLSITPAIGSTNNPTQVSVSVTFSSPVATSSITTNGTNTTCTGSVQISVNDFSTCIRVRTVVPSSDSRTLVLNHVGLPNGQKVQIRVLTSLLGQASEKLQAEYTSGQFAIVNPPCGTSNCYQSFVNGLGSATGAGAHLFRISAGTFNGQYGYVLGGGTQTIRILNVNTFTTVIAPFSLISSGAEDGSHTISLTTGANAGSHLVVHAGLSADTTRINMNINSATAGPNLTAVGNLGAHSVEFTTGPRKGKHWIVHANGTSASNTFDPETFSITNNPIFGATITVGGPLSFFVDQGLKSGESFTFRGNGSTQGYFSDNLGTFRSTVSSPNTGSGWTQIPGGSRKGQFFIASGSGGGTQIYTPATDIFTAGPSTGALAAGSCVAALRHGNNVNKVLIAVGTGSMLTKLYDPETNTVVSGPNLPLMLGNDSLCTVIEGGLYPDSILLAVGADIILYFP